MNRAEIPVISCEESVRLEKLAIAGGGGEEELIERAGISIASIVEKYLLANKIIKHIILLAGKGNNGADGYSAARQLLKKGVAVTAMQLFSKKELSPLCAKHLDHFVSEGGEVLFFEQREAIFPREGVILDAIFGTGFKGSMDEWLLDLIKKANSSSLPIISIDCPSGLNATSGEILQISIKANLTIYMGLPKVGYFVKDGFEVVGRLAKGDFCDEKIFENAKETFWLLNEKTLLLPPIKRTRHKYEAGMVIGIGGSIGMCGAVKLAALAALRSGAGMVYLFTPQDTKEEMGSSPYEIVKHFYSTDLSKLIEEVKRGKSIFIGPGLGRRKEVNEFLAKILHLIDKPSVIDADALFFLAEDPSLKVPPKSILTPHKKELLRLLRQENEDETFFDKTQKLSNSLNVVIILKGSPNFVFIPTEKPIVVPVGDPGMATAGAGDVLTGVIAAFLAQGLDRVKSSLLGVYIHGKAGEIAALEKTSYSLIASDIIQTLSKAFKLLKEI